MQRMTILIASSAGEATTASLERHLPAIEAHLLGSGGILGRPFRLESWSDRDWQKSGLFDSRGWRSEEGCKALADRVRARPDIAAVVMWGGSWLSVVASGLVDVFLRETCDLPIVVISGTCREDHAKHPGSFSIIPRERDRKPILQRVIAGLPCDAIVGWISRTNYSAEEIATVREACRARGIEHWELLLPADFATEGSSEQDFQALLEQVRQRPAPSHWFGGLFAMNLPLLHQVSTWPGFSEFIALNTGRYPDWQTDRQTPRRVSFVEDSARENPDLALTRRLGLDAHLARITLDELLLLHFAGTTAEPLPDTATRQEVFAAWVDALKRIDGSRAVFVGTRTIVWFDPATRFRANGGILLGERSKGELYRHPLQVRRASDGGTVPVPVVYLYVDLLTIERVSIEDQTADLDFYLDLRCLDPIGIEELRFANVDPGSITTQVLVDHSEQEPEGLVHVKRYRIRGRFGFPAQLECFPFDCQALHVDICPANPASRPMHLQGPPRSTLDREFDVPGWSIIDVEHSEHTQFWHAPQSVRFKMIYRSFRGLEFQWLLRRRAKDTILFVAVPMAVLLGVSYFAAFASPQDSDGKVELLSATMLATIALYFATPKPRSDELTILDRAFRVAYICVGGLLGTILIMEHFFSDWWYVVVVRSWLALMPALMLREVARCLRLIRRQSESFRNAVPSPD